MDTRIELEEPYKSIWRFGYLVTNSENRKNVVLYNSHDDRTTCSYARYIVSCLLGRFLTEFEEVDHINEDKTFDVIENLQVISTEDNIRKQNYARGHKMAYLICPECRTRFRRRTGNTQAVKCYKGRISCCTKICQDKFKTRKLDKEFKDLVSEESLLLVRLEKKEYKVKPLVSNEYLLSLVKQNDTFARFK
ncbi:hypothetical protein [Vibrio phage vB_VibM_10AMN]|uniref:Uncharacterized protein n=1 Tax=Staphylococcus phage vB_VibM_10AMN12 TaxID=3076785 RepID=A0AA96KT33_9CAUD|nr:hypothetical protein [Vibrio phage vB_VibM_10AMN]WNO47511.1 hypothetical protein [Staphylococcus phage vB_VibM_10AMN12]